jgi:hypothetical protein
LKLLELDGKNSLILWSDAPVRSVIRVSYLGSSHEYFSKAENVTGRDMNADCKIVLIDEQEDVTIAVLFGENKIEVLKSRRLIQDKIIRIEEWVDDSPKDDSVRGTVLFVPGSDLLLAAKVGENKIVFKSYSEANKNSPPFILTVFESIYHLIIPQHHKILVVFDNQQDLIAYYRLSKIIGCPPDRNILSCSQIFLNDDIECSTNQTWNSVTKKCSCVAGFFFDEEQKKCEKCTCSG